MRGDLKDKTQSAKKSAKRFQAVVKVRVNIWRQERTSLLEEWKRRWRE